MRYTECSSDTVIFSLFVETAAIRLLKCLLSLLSLTKLGFDRSSKIVKIFLTQASS